MGLLGKLESFGKALWDTGRDVVDVVADVAAVVDGAGAIGDFIERVGTAAHLDDVIEVGGRLSGWAERVGVNKFLRAADSAILDGGQLLIAGMKLTTGIGEPEDGERFGRGGQRSHDAAATLRSAAPTADWSGDGANSYTAKNTTQVVRARTMAATDHEVHRALATEAFQVGFHRDKLDDWYDWLADVGLVTFALGLIPEVGQGLKAAAEAHAVLVAVASSSVELYQLSSEVEANTAALRRLVGRYDDIAQTAKPARAEPDLEPLPPPPPSVAPEAAPSSGGAPGASAPFVAPTRSPGGSGSGSAGGATSGGDVAAPSGPQPPAAAAAPMQRASEGGGAPAAPGAPPAATGGALPGLMSPGATPMAAPAGLIKEAVQAAMRQEAEKRAKHGESKYPRDPNGQDGDGKPDADGKPGDDKTDEPEAAPGGIETGRAPVHIELDVDVERLGRPITVTVDRESSIGSPSTPAT
jgi:hypothetical protein